MKGRLCVQMFSFDQPFQSYQKDDFAKVKLTVNYYDIQVLERSNVLI